MPAGDLTQREIIKIQFLANKHLRDALIIIRNECEDALRFASKSGFKPNRSIERCHKVAASELAWLDIQGAKVDELKKGKREKDTTDILDYGGTR